MRLIQSDDARFVFQISKREKRLLFEVLKLYPLIPPAHHRVNRSGKGAAFKSSQKLLDEALAEQRQENKKHLLEMLNEESRFVESQHGCSFSLSRPEADWVLQVLNDVRVGSWLLLGEPDETKGKSVELTAENARYVWAMDLSAHFESVLLDAFDQPGLA